MVYVHRPISRRYHLWVRALLRKPLEKEICNGNK